MVLLDARLQAGLGQPGQVGKSFSQGGEAAQVAPDDVQHFPVAEAPQAGFQPMFLDRFRQRGDFRRASFVQIPGPTRKPGNRAFIICPT